MRHKFEIKIFSDEEDANKYVKTKKGWDIILHLNIHRVEDKDLQELRSFVSKFCSQDIFYCDTNVIRPLLLHPYYVVFSDFTVLYRKELCEYLGTFGCAFLYSGASKYKALSYGCSLKKENRVKQEFVFQKTEKNIKLKFV